MNAYQQYHAIGFEVVSVDEQEDLGTVNRCVDTFEMQLPVALDSSGQVGQTFRFSDGMRRIGTAAGSPDVTLLLSDGAAG